MSFELLKEINVVIEGKNDSDDLVKNNTHIKDEDSAKDRAKHLGAVKFGKHITPKGVVFVHFFDKNNREVMYYSPDMIELTGIVEFPKGREWSEGNFKSLHFRSLS